MAAYPHRLGVFRVRVKFTIDESTNGVAEVYATFLSPTGAKPLIPVPDPDESAGQTATAAAKRALFTAAEEAASRWEAGDHAANAPSTTGCE
jgi:hypothetical protein